MENLSDTKRIKKMTTPSDKTKLSDSLKKALKEAEKTELELFSDDAKRVVGEDYRYAGFLDVSSSVAPYYGDYDDQDNYESLDSVWVDSFDRVRFAREVSEQVENPLVAYWLDRVLRHGETSAEDWEAKIEQDYYGDIIGEVTLNDHTQREIKQQLDLLENIKDFKSYVETILRAEYGYLLPELEKIKEWKIEHVKFEQLEFSSQKHLDNLSEELLSAYRDYKHIRGIVIDTGRTKGPRYSVIDGYHRLSAAPDSALLKVIVGRR